MSWRSRRSRWVRAKWNGDKKHDNNEGENSEGDEPSERSETLLCSLVPNDAVGADITILLLQGVPQLVQLA